MKDNLWILTEEKPKTSVLLQIIEAYSEDFGKDFEKVSSIEVVPLLDQNGLFTFTYKITGINIEGACNIYIKTVSGTSSFVDFLVFKMESEPEEGQIKNLLMAIEETKTSDGDSRNTGVYQRCTKFVHIRNYSDKVKLYMLYNEDTDHNDTKEPSDTNIFGTNLLLNMGVKIIGKDTDIWFNKFESLDQLISFRDGMRKPPKGNVPIEIKMKNDMIEVSGRLAKPKDAGNIGHDPNIGALSAITYVIRELGWDKEILITQHGVRQNYVSNPRTRNKFLIIANQLDLNMKGLDLNRSLDKPKTYWKYEKSSEKVASILLHLAGENFGLKEVYQNHAGSERGFFRTQKNELLALPKKDKNNINLFIPDVILQNEDSKEILLIEAKQLRTLENGVREIEQYDSIENEFIKPYYKHHSITRWVTTFGGDIASVPHPKVLLHLNLNGDIFINDNAPHYIKKMFNKDTRKSV